MSKLNDPIDITPMRILVAVIISPLLIAFILGAAANEAGHKIQKMQVEICSLPPGIPTIPKREIVDEETPEIEEIPKPKKEVVPKNINTVFEVPNSGNSNVDEFIQRFAHVAIAEMHNYGIPASITLAQGILESRYGTSPLAKEANNFFGVKGRGGPKKHDDCCKSKRCKNPDSFRRYSTAWESFRHHSHVLMAERYQKRIKRSKDPKAWAKALKAGGYAKDPKYVQKILNTISTYNLTMYDKKVSKYSLVATN